MRHSKFILAFAIAALVPAVASAADCTMEQLAVSAHSVIDPCTARLKQPRLADSETSLAHFVRGRGYHRTQRLDEARKDYRVAFSLDPKNEEILVSWANVDLRQNRMRDYVARLQQAHDLNSKNAHVLRAIGQMFINFGDKDQAIESFTKALSIDPAEPFALSFRARLYRERRMMKEALADANALVAIPRKTLDDYGFLDEDGVMRDFLADALLSRAFIREDINDLDGALQDYDAAVAIERSAKALYLRGWFLRSHLKRHEDALRDTEEAVRLEPDHHDAQLGLGYALSALKRYEDAFRAFDRAVALQPDDGDSLRMRAMMHRELGRTEAAVADLEAAVSRDPVERARMVQGLRRAGYWTSRQSPQGMTAELRDAIRACMIDTSCN